MLNSISKNLNYYYYYYI